VRLSDLCKKLQEDEESLQEKISKKQADLDRCKKRLKVPPPTTPLLASPSPGQDLENVRPAFMDEFEKLEKELAKIYGTYVEKFRNVEASPLPSPLAVA
jgi:clusterin-associated protein 1